jgi:hypothetical protein
MTSEGKSARRIPTTGRFGATNGHSVDALLNYAARKENQESRVAP